MAAIAGAILAAQEAEREGVISLSSPEYQDTVVKQEMLSDEAIARAMQAAEAMHARKLQIQVDSDSDDGDDGAPQHVGTVVESTASQAPQPGMCITIPGMGFGRMLIVTPDIIRQLSAEELIDETTRDLDLEGGQQLVPHLFGVLLHVASPLLLGELREARAQGLDERATDRHTEANTETETE